jgi:hypothetical protein
LDVAAIPVLYHSCCGVTARRVLKRGHKS